jgi:hypothetical protein
MVRSGWEKNITPQAVVRGLGPFGMVESEDTWHVSYAPAV